MNDLQRAIDVLRAGGLVAFPTETVYGLGADARNATAVEKIFAAKGRPGTNPLIVHVADAAVARRYAAAWPAAARRLAEAFWPGPLTLVLTRDEAIVPAVSAGLGTVGLRVPDHPLALALLQSFNGPVAAPSANRSNRISPTTAGHVASELGPAVDLILDGGPCRVGIESTVLSLVGEPTILRPGSVSREQIEAVIGPVRAGPADARPGEAAHSPGQGTVHYAPQKPAFRLEKEALGGMHVSDAGVLVFGSIEILGAQQVVDAGADPAEAAARLYAALRALDASEAVRILVVMPPDESAWLAVRDRIRRATRPLA